MHCGKLIKADTGEEVPHCRVCGEPATLTFDNSKLDRCDKHADRNPCAIEGCRRSTDADGRLDNGEYWLCGTHWKIGVPPRSRMRRQYHRYLRKAKAHGWETRAGAKDNLYRQRFWMFWHKKLLPSARNICEEGRVDVEQIHRMFGWDMEE